MLLAFPHVLDHEHHFLVFPVVWNNMCSDIMCTSVWYSFTSCSKEGTFVPLLIAGLQHLPSDDMMQQTQISFHLNTNITKANIFFFSVFQYFHLKTQFGIQFLSWCILSMNMYKYHICTCYILKIKFNQNYKKNFWKEPPID